MPKWSEKWQTLFNFGKYKCLLERHGNEDIQYTMRVTALNSTEKEKELELTIIVDVKVSEKCRIAVPKRNQIIAWNMWNIMDKKQDLVIPLYKTPIILKYSTSMEAISQERFWYARKNTQNSNQDSWILYMKSV